MSSLLVVPLVPSTPQNLTVNLLNSTLTVTWDPPSSPNGVVSYEVNITISDLATGVVGSLGESIMRNDSNRLVELNLSMEPFVRYSVSVLAGTIAGQSEVVSTNITTAEGGEVAVVNYRDINIAEDR